MFCKNCGRQISDDSKFCPSCGAEVSSIQSQATHTARYVQPAKKKKPIYRRWWFWVLVLIVLSSVSQAIRGRSSSTTNTSTPGNTASTAVVESTPKPTSAVEVSQPTAQAAVMPSTDWLQQYEDDGIPVLSVDADVMYQYGAYYTGYTACTVVEVADTDSKSIKANTDNNDSFFFSFVFDFADSSEISGINDGDVVEVVGTIKAPSAIGDTITLEDCHVVAVGSEAETVRASLSGSSAQQIEYAERYVAELQAAAEVQASQDAEAYKAACSTVDYEFVNRNPNAYEGQQITFSGSVIQVSEGWFNTVTLRVSQNGNVWYVTYSRADDNESRILEGDKITVYGECTGVTSYISILGNTVTIPSVKAVYID